MHTYWVSLSDPAQEEGKMFVAVVILQQETPEGAASEALKIVKRDRGSIAREGDIELFELDGAEYPPHLMNRALDAAGAVEAGGEHIKITTCDNCGTRTIE
jgi:hypothetical protein